MNAKFEFIQQLGYELWDISSQILSWSIVLVINFISEVLNETVV